jgi:hypothetical protein
MFKDRFLKDLAETVAKYDRNNPYYTEVIKDGLAYCNRIDSSVSDDDVINSIITKIWCLLNNVSVHLSFILDSSNLDKYLYSIAKNFTDNNEIINYDESDVIVIDSSRHIFKIPVKFNFEFLAHWYRIRSSYDNFYSHNIRKYLYNLIHDNDLDVNDVEKDYYLSEKDFKFHCDFIVANIELIKQNETYTFKFAD